MCPSSFSALGPPGPGRRGRDQTYTKTFLGQVGMCAQILNGSVQGFEFPLALNISTDRQTNKHL